MKPSTSSSLHQTRVRTAHPRASVAERRQLASVFTIAAHQHGQMERLLADLFTPAEVDEFAMRWRIIQCLSLGWTHRRVAEELGVGIATVTRGARELRDPSSALHRILKRLPSSLPA